MKPEKLSRNNDEIMKTGKHEGNNTSSQDHTEIRIHQDNKRGDETTDRQETSRQCDRQTRKEQTEWQSDKFVSDGLSRMPKFIPKNGQIATKWYKVGTF